MKQAGNKMPGRVPAGKGWNFTNATAADPDAWKHDRTRAHCGWRMMYVPDVARIAGVTERCAGRILVAYCDALDRRNFQTDEPSEGERMAVMFARYLDAGIAEETAIRVVAVATYMTRHRIEAADSLGEKLAEEAAFIMREPMAGGRK